MTPVVTATPVDILGMRVRKIILIGDGWRGCEIRLRLYAVHQILLR